MRILFKSGKTSRLTKKEASLIHDALMELDGKDSWISINYGGTRTKGFKASEIVAILN